MNRKLKHIATVIVFSILGTASAVATMTVNTMGGVLNVACDQSGMVVAKVVAPDNTLLVDERYEGNQFSWSPSDHYDMDGAYRYDVCVIIRSMTDEEAKTLSEYAGGSLEVRNGEIINPPMHYGKEQ